MENQIGAQITPQSTQLSYWLALAPPPSYITPVSRSTPKMPYVESISLSHPYLLFSGQVWLSTLKICWYCWFVADFSHSHAGGKAFSVQGRKYFSTGCCNALWGNCRWKPRSLAKMTPWHLVACTRRYRQSAGKQTQKQRLSEGFGALLFLAGGMLCSALIMTASLDIVSDSITTMNRYSTCGSDVKDIPIDVSHAGLDKGSSLELPLDYLYTTLSFVFRGVAETVWRWKM